MKKKTLPFIISAALLASCTNEAGKLNKTNLGMVGGAVGGALIGSQFGGGSGQMLATVAGAALGGFAGKTLGSRMDKADLQAQNNARISALQNNKNGTTYTWHSKKSGASGSITPTKSYTSSSKKYCREFVQKVTIAGKSERAVGTACKQANDDWKIVQ